MPYTPFLKLKQNEIMALKELDSPIKEEIIPFLDFPKGKDESVEVFVKHALGKAKQIKAHLGKSYQLYLDTFDIDDMTINGTLGYEYLLHSFSDLSIIPVTGLDRTDEHNQSIINSKNSGINKCNVLALRLLAEDFESYDVIKEELEECIVPLMKYFESIDLILDCRMCLNTDDNILGDNIIRFLQYFSSNYPVNKVIVSGSSIPSRISDICDTKSENLITRKEVLIYSNVRENYALTQPLYIGDYTTVSPEYSSVEIDPGLLQKVMTSKLIYSFNNQHHIWRGGSLDKNGYSQYNNHLRTLISYPFYRLNFSWADKVFYQKQGDTSGFGPGSMIKHTVNAHISFMAKIGV